MSTRGPQLERGPLEPFGSAVVFRLGECLDVPCDLFWSIPKELVSVCLSNLKGVNN